MDGGIVGGIWRWAIWEINGEENEIVDRGTDTIIQGQVQRIFSLGFIIILHLRNRLFLFVAR